MSADVHPSSPRRDLQGGVAWTALGSVIVALSCGGLTALLVTLVFEQLFYVRLP